MSMSACRDRTCSLGGLRNVAVAVPNDEEYTWLVDLNKDGKQDILMHHPFTLRDAHGARRLPPGTEPHRVTDADCPISKIRASTSQGRTTLPSARRSSAA